MVESMGEVLSQTVWGTRYGQTPGSPRLSYVTLGQTAAVLVPFYDDNFDVLLGLDF